MCNYLNYQFIHPNPDTFNSPARQYFSVPFDVISYIIQNPISPDGLLKLQKTCKHFFAKNKIVVFHNKYIYLGEDGIYFRFFSDGRKEDFSTFRNLNFWPAGSFSGRNTLEQTMQHPINIPSNIYRCSFHEFYISDYNFTLNEINFLFDDGQSIKRLCLLNVDIRDNNGIIVSIDRIMGMVPNAFTFEHLSKNEIFTNGTFQKLMDLQRKPKWLNFEIGFCLIAEDIDFSILFNFIRKTITEGSWIMFRFNNGLEPFQKMLQIEVNKLLVTWKREFKRRVHVFICDL